MFTVKIVNNNDGSSSLRSWESVDIHKRGTGTFESLIKDERAKWSTENLSEDAYEAMMESIDTHSAILRTVDGDLNYYLCEHQTVYIMDAAGNTVECIR